MFWQVPTISEVYNSIGLLCSFALWSSAVFILLAVLTWFFVALRVALGVDKENKGTVRFLNSTLKVVKCTGLFFCFITGIITFLHALIPMLT